MSVCRRGDVWWYKFRLGGHVIRESDSYYLCMSGNSDESSTNKDDGEWGVIVEKRRSSGQRLRGAGKIAVNDKMMKTIEEILCAEPSIREVHREE
jgi:hypothetical protein